MKYFVLVKSYTSNHIKAFDKIVIPLKNIFNYIRGVICKSFFVFSMETLEEI